MVCRQHSEVAFSPGAVFVDFSGPCKSSKNAAIRIEARSDGPTSPAIKMVSCPLPAHVEQGDRRPISFRFLTISFVVLWNSTRQKDDPTTGFVTQL